MKGSPKKLSERDLEILFFYYTFSDQHGVVDVKAASSAAGVALTEIKTFQIQQKHVDILMDHGVIPDVRLLFNKILLDVKSLEYKRNKRKKKF